MALSKDERIDIVLHAAIGSYRAIADDFNTRHPERHPITHNKVFSHKNAFNRKFPICPD